MTRFRPCIDLHSGQVKQIVGATLTRTASTLHTNHVSSHSAAHFARAYRDHGLEGAHIILLGPGNVQAARDALVEWPGHFQVGGGITDLNAQEWIGLGAAKVIVTSFLFPHAAFSWAALRAVLHALQNDVGKLVIDLSCKRSGDRWMVAMDKWQTLTDLEVNRDTIRLLEPHCSEFLVHAADHEGLQRGIDQALVRKLGEWCTIPVTYAGGSRTVDDLRLVEELSLGKVDLTIGSALDIFGGSGARLADCVQWNKAKEAESG
ncbi:MAG: Enzyme that catalyzes the fourth step in the histidine pathway [Phylliscum demangeonii]|nr:MAG: Enzyme that catalyzes the fourth step in the histidine pathway [Phylliscum demangeonii]